MNDKLKQQRAKNCSFSMFRLNQEIVFARAETTQPIIAFPFEPNHPCDEWCERVQP